MEQEPKVNQEVAAPETVQTPTEETEASEEVVESFTKEQLDSAVADVVAAERQRQSGYQKQINTAQEREKSLEKERDTVTDTLRRLEEEADNRLLESIKDEPGANAIRDAQTKARQRLVEANAKLKEATDKERELSTLTEAGKRYFKLADAQAVEDKYELPAGTIAKQADKLPDKAAMEAFAEALKESGLNKPVTPTTKPVFSGTGTPIGKMSFEQIEQAFAEGKISAAKYAEARHEKGLN